MNLSALQSLSYGNYIERDADMMLQDMLWI